VAQTFDLVALIEKIIRAQSFTTRVRQAVGRKKISRSAKFPCILVFFFYICLTQFAQKCGVEITPESNPSLVPWLP
jgi:hypothetical protein